MSSYCLGVAMFRCVTNAFSGVCLGTSHDVLCSVFQLTPAPETSYFPS
jgi:hypothetical protein